MPDPRMMQSLHLEGLPRRELYRAARAKLESDCGHLTLYGKLADSVPVSDPGDGATVAFNPDMTRSFWVQDGEHLLALQVGINSVGRLPENEVVIRDECVSRRHCAIVVHRDGRCELHDVASKNGTILNGSKIGGPTHLKSGDSITLCSKKLIFLVHEEPAQKSA